MTLAGGLPGDGGPDRAARDGGCCNASEIGPVSAAAKRPAGAGNPDAPRQRVDPVLGEAWRRGPAGDPAPPANNNRPGGARRREVRGLVRSRPGIQPSGIRRADCGHYDLCLTAAARRNELFDCRGCKKFTADLSNHGTPLGYAKLLAAVFLPELYAKFLKETENG